MEQYLGAFIYESYYEITGSALVIIFEEIWKDQVTVL